MGFSPLDASTVGLIKNPKTNHISPQFHCVYDDNFETVHSNDPNNPPPIWDDLIINHRFRSDYDFDVDVVDTWEQPAPSNPGDSPGTVSLQVPVPTTSPSTEDCAPSSAEVIHEPVTPSVQTPTPTAPSSVEVSPVPPDAHVEPSATASPRRSGRIRKSVDRFKFTPANGYSVVQAFGKKLICTMLQTAYNLTKYNFWITKYYV